MAICDVRPMHADDVQPAWDFIKKKSKTLIDVTQDDGRWFATIKGLGWKAHLNSGGFNFKSRDAKNYPLTDHSFAYLDFYPPGGGNIRFDTLVNFKSHPKIMAEVAILLIEHGGAGKNRVGYFIGGAPSPKPTAPPNETITQGGSLWDFIRFWR